jgi:SAM-dependent methyltransferase
MRMAAYKNRMLGAASQPPANPRLAGVTWDDMYRGQPLWEIGRAQQAFVDLAERGEIAGSVLDIGCGTGENALYLAARGHEVWGVDLSAVAIERGMVKAHARRLPVVFLAGDALDAAEIGRTFDTLIDSGCFHTLNDADRVRYAASVKALSTPGSRLHVACFSEAEPPGWGPRRVTQAELRAVFVGDWTVEGITAVRYETITASGGAEAWLASFTRPA